MNLFSFVKQLDFLGGKYRMSKEDSILQGFDFCYFNCKNQQSSRRNDQVCGASLLFEVVKSELEVVPDLNKLAEYSDHSES